MYICVLLVGRQEGGNGRQEGEKTEVYLSFSFFFSRYIVFDKKIFSCLRRYVSGCFRSVQKVLSEALKKVIYVSWTTYWASIAAT